jgi:peptidoglycan/xylan/chitin deacetylase (PgdA/CDA1 family)
MALIPSTPLPVLRAAGNVWRSFDALLSARGTGRGRCLVVTYHDIGTGLSPALFRRQMEYLSRVASVVPFETLLRIARSGFSQGISCAITFDDGYESVYRHAFPCLLKHGFPAMVYLTAGVIRGSNGEVVGTERYGLIQGRKLLSWHQVREMNKHGVQFGSHLYEHLDLSLLGQNQAMEQLRRSRDEISSRLGKQCEHLAYPFGRFTMQGLKWVHEAGYRTGVTTVHLPLAADNDPLRLPRMGIEDRFSLRDFQRIISGDWDFVGWLQTLRRPILRAGLRPASNCNEAALESQRSQHGIS